MQKSALEHLAEKGIVTIQKKKGEYLVECITKDEAGFLTESFSEWGSDLVEALRKLENKIGDR